MLYAVAALYVLTSLFDLAFCFWGPYPLGAVTWSDAPYFAIVALHLAWGGAAVALIAWKGSRGSKRTWTWYARMPELLGAVTLAFFLFSYIYALNANMDYAQRFAATSGNLRLAQDTREERIIAVLRYMPLLLAGAAGYLGPRIWAGRALERTIRSPRKLTRWSFVLVIVSAFFSALAFPSFVSLEGLSFLAFISLVPVLLVIRSTSYGWAVFYGTIYGVFYVLVLNYWLGTFDYVTLQITTVASALFFLLFMLPTVWLSRRIRWGGFLVFPLAWVVFDYVRSLGFLGYPWGTMGASQYGFLPLIQTASLAGVWGVTFVVLLVDAGVAEVLYDILIQRTVGFGRPRLAPLYVSLGLLLVSVLGGSVSLHLQERRVRRTARGEVRVALVQQNSDPRKHAYSRTFDSLRSLSDQAAVYEPDLIVWSETAFVPNIRRWSQEDPEVYTYARLVREFLEYQKDLGRWLLTGNDDYELVPGPDGEVERFDYNATVLFAPDGRRIETYRKLHLVPFTEYFPFEETFPRFYELLQNFDVYLWEPGDRRIIFDHPELSFATPICFEDVFPSDIRRFVRDGAAALVTVSNDYWSQTPVEAKQHYVHSLFRAVENRVPLLKAGASGFTSYVEPTGRLVAGVPYYEEAYLIADVPTVEARLTPYTLIGDWLPLAAVAMLFALLVVSLVRDPGLRK